MTTWLEREILEHADGVLGAARQPPYTVSTTTIYARTTGNDTTGDGSLSNPYATFVRAVRDIPSPVPRGARYSVNVTGLNEVLPADFELPAWKSSEMFDADAAAPFFQFTSAISIEADPQLYSGISTADATVAAADVLSSVQDPVTQLRTITLNVARPSWGANALKGRICHGSGTAAAGNTVTILQSDTTFIVIGGTGAITTPFFIMEPSATLSGPTVAGFKGCLNAFNVDSISFNGLRIFSTSAGRVGLQTYGSGHVNIQCCDLTYPSILNNAPQMNRLGCNWVHGDEFDFGGQIFFTAGLIDTVPFLGFTQGPPGLYSFRRSGIIGCGPLDATISPPGGPAFAAAPSDLLCQNLLVKNGTGDGIRWHGGRGFFSRVDVYGCVGNGIVADQGSGFLSVLNCQSTGVANGGYGILVNDGLQVKVDAATSGASSPLNGTSGQMKVGGGAARTFANFVSGADSRPALNEYDITAAAATGATGTGSRLFQ